MSLAGSNSPTPPPSPRSPHPPAYPGPPGLRLVVPLALFFAVPKLSRLPGGRSCRAGCFANSSSNDDRQAGRTKKRTRGTLSSFGFSPSAPLSLIPARAGHKNEWCIIPSLSRASLELSARNETACRPLSPAAAAADGCPANLLLFFFRHSPKQSAHTHAHARTHTHTHRYDCVYVGAGCDPDLTLPYLQGLLNVGGVMVAPFREELVRMEVWYGMVWYGMVWCSMTGGEGSCGGRCVFGASTDRSSSG